MMRMDGSAASESRHKREDGSKGAVEPQIMGNLQRASEIASWSRARVDGRCVNEHTVEV